MTKTDKTKVYLFIVFMRRVERRRVWSGAGWGRMFSFRPGLLWGSKRESARNGGCGARVGEGWVTGINGMVGVRVNGANLPHLSWCGVVFFQVHMLW